MHIETTSTGSEQASLWGRARQAFVHVPETFALVRRASPVAALTLAVCAVAMALLPLAVAYGGKRVVDAVVAGDQAATLEWVLIELGVVVLALLFTRLHMLTQANLGARLAVDINVAILERAQTLELRHFEDPEFYDRLTRARREASSRPVAMVVGVFQLAQGVVSVLGAVGVLLAFSGVAVLGLAAAAVPAALAELRYSAAAFRLRNWRSPDTRRLYYLEHVLTNDGHAKEVMTLGLGPLLLGRYRGLAEGFDAEDRALSVRRAGFGALWSVIATLAFYGVYAFVALEAVAGRISLGTMTMYVLAFRHGQQAFQSVLSALGGMFEHNLYLSNLFEFLRREPLPAAATVTHPDRGPSLESGSESESERGVRFDRVSFKYPGRDAWALKDVDLMVPAGRSLALVGHNGAGKTTLIKLLMGLYTPTSGRVLLDGRPLSDWPAEALRARIAVVFQDFNRYQLPARENVGFGSVDALDDDARIARALERGGATADLEKLKDGLDTQLGRWFKDGVELSGGQWQKVALSRAFMREEADVLVLDEPTAALDAEAEHAVFERFRALTEGRTALLISHRFPTVRMADHIVVLEGGQIVEQGSHDALIAADGRYARLFKLQAQGYT